MSDTTTVRVLNDGPLYVEGLFKVVTASGKELPVEGGKCALCRCGGSEKKPFCDGTHKRAGFQASEE